MVSMVSPRQTDHSDDLVLVGSPSLREWLGESEFSHRAAASTKPPFGRRAARAFVRYLVAFCAGVAAILAWQSYGDAARQTLVSWVAQNGLSSTWLSYIDGAKTPAPSRAQTSEAAPAAAAAIASAREPSASSSDLQQLKTMTLGLASTLSTMRERIDQLAAGQEQTASDIAKLQAAEQDIRHKIATPPPRPAAAASPKPIATAPAPARTPPPPR